MYSGPSTLSRLFDFYSYKRVQKEFTDASSLGALISLAGLALMAFLFTSETISFLAVRPSETVALAPTHSAGELLPVRFNITFPKISCSLLSLSIYDALGTSIVNASSSQVHFYKWGSGGGANALVHSGLGSEGYALEEVHGAAAGSGDENALPAPEGSGATEINGGNFESFVKERKLAIITYGAPWCPWCQRLAPVWNEVAQVVGTSVPGVGVGAVDCTKAESGELCQGQHIQAFPTIQLYAEGIPHSHLSYSGPRTKEAILAWLVRAVQLGEDLVTAPDQAHTALLGHAESPEETAGHEAARTRLLALMSQPEDIDSDPAAPGPAQALIEAIHKAGLHAPGDKARAALVASSGEGDAAAAAAAAESSNQGGGVGGGGVNGGAAGPPPAIGCQVVGEVSVKRVPGRMIINVAGNERGQSVQASTVNLTHIVHTFYFGKERLTPLQLGRVGGGKFEKDQQRLAGGVFPSTNPLTSHVHYLSLVPYIFKFSTGHSAMPLAYTAASASHTEPKGKSEDEGFPSVSFAYDVSPLAITVTEARRSMWQWAVSMAALLGGVVTALSILDTFLHSIAGTITKKKA